MVLLRLCLPLLLLGSCAVAPTEQYRPPAGRVLFSLAGQDLWQGAPDGSDRRQITRDGGPSGSGYIGGRWSPDGTLIAAERNLATESGTGLYLVDPGTGTGQRLSRPDTFIDGYAWAPDGRSLTFGQLTSGGTPGPGGGVIGGVGEVLLYDVASKSIRVLGPGTHPSFSPDGKLVGFAHAAGSVAVVDLATSAVTHLATLADLGRQSVQSAPRGMGLVGGPVWSADGKQIAFAAIENGPILEAVQIVYVQEPKPGAPAKQWAIGKTGAVHHVAELRWSPTKPLLGYSLINAQPHHHWFGVIDPGDPKLRELHNAVQHFIDYAWAPDGETVLLQLDDEDAWAIFRLGRPGIAYRTAPGGWRPDWCRCP